MIKACFSIDLGIISNFPAHHKALVATSAVTGVRQPVNAAMLLQFVFLHFYLFTNQMDTG